MLSLIIIGAGLTISASEKANLLVIAGQTNTVFHGIDFKNPFTMSNRRGLPLAFRRSGRVFSSSLDMLVEHFA